MKQEGFKKYRTHILITVAAAVLVLSLVPTHSVNACILSTSPITNCIQEGMAYILFLIFSIVGNVIAFLVKLLDIVIQIQIYPPEGVAVIDTSWKIMRNFANMFFVVALIMMAFATIFDVLPGAAKYNARALFGKFLFTALLINFSLVLGTIVIDASQVLTNTFLTPIGDISAHLGEGLRPDKLLAVNLNDQATFATAIEQTLSSALIGLVFSLVLLVTMTFSLLTATLFAIIRIPILWALLIVSPIAWIMNIFPAGEGMFKKWWSTFVGWNMFLPIFLFFLYFGLYFLQSQDAVITAIAQQTTNQSLGEGVPFTFQIFFFYVLTAIFLIGGTMAAMKASMFSGTGVTQVAGWARGVVANRMGLTAAGRAAKGRYEEFQEKGQARVDRGTARFRDIIGGVTFGRRGFQEEQLAKDITTIKKRFERITDPEQLRKLMERGPDRDRLAATEILKDRKLLTEKERRAGYELYEKNSPLGAKQFARSLDYDQMSADERKFWLGKVPDIETQQKIVNAMANKGDRYLTNKEEGAEQNLNKILGLFGLEGEQRDLLKKIEKHNFELATKVGLQNQLLMRAGKAIEDTPEGLKIAMEEIISRMNPDALLEATRSLTDFASKSPENNKLVLGALNQQKIETMMAKGTKQQLESWQKISPNKFDAEKIKAEKERVARELAEITGKATGEAIIRSGGLGRNIPAGPTPPQMSNVNPGNVVDLRAGEKRSPGGIILTPGAQAEIERERRNNP